MRATPHHEVALRRAFVIAALFAAITFGVSAGSVSAHTEIDETVPADGDVVGTPVDEITVAFLEPVERIDNGFEVFTPQGEIVEPPVETDDDIAFRLLFDPPLAGGDVGVRYEVRAQDGHIIDGSFSFRVEAPPPTTAPQATTTSLPVSATTAPPATTEPTVATTAPSAAAPAATTSPPTSAPTDTTVASTAASTVAPESTASEDDDGGGSTLLVIVVALAALAGVGGLLLVRGRSGDSPDAT